MQQIRIGLRIAETSVDTAVVPLNLQSSKNAKTSCSGFERGDVNLVRKCTAQLRVRFSRQAAAQVKVKGTDAVSVLLGERFVP